MERGRENEVDKHSGRDGQGSAETSGRGWRRWIQAPTAWNASVRCYWRRGRQALRCGREEGGMATAMEAKIPQLDKVGC